MATRPIIVSIPLVAAALCAGCGAEPAPPEADLGPTPTLAPPPEGEGFQIDEGKFAVASGREALYCERFPIPETYGDAPFFVRGVESLLPLGTHHFFMSYAEGALASREACVGGEPLLDLSDPVVQEASHNAVDGKLAFTSAVGETSYSLPDGYGVYMSTGLGHFTTSHHILNLSADRLTMYGVFNVYTAAEVPHPVNVVNCTLRDISIPPHAKAALSGTCSVPFDIDMVVLSSHAHQYLSRFEMRIHDGAQTLPEIIYESETWDSPAIVPLAQPLRLTAGQGLTFTCHFENPTDQEITYGAGELKEMCAIMSAYAYPSDRIGDVPPTLGGVVYTEGERTDLIDTTEIGGNF